MSTAAIQPIVRGRMQTTYKDTLTGPSQSGSCVYVPAPGTSLLKMYITARVLSTSGTSEVVKDSYVERVEAAYVTDATGSAAVPQTEAVPSIWTKNSMAGTTFTATAGAGGITLAYGVASTLAASTVVEVKVTVIEEGL